jgi:ClpP class serine protease
MKRSPRIAPASQLLADFIAAPVGMLPARHLALIGDLHASCHAPRGALTEGGRSVEEWSLADGCSGEPWCEPLYAVDASTGIALLEVKGPLVKGYDDVTAWAYACASIDRLSRNITELDALVTAGRVRAIVVCLNTPGGVSTGMLELADQLAALAARCPVITHTSDLACSNGMRLALAGSLFLPTASATVGCIGTYIALYDYTEHLRALGIKLELYRAGDYKAIGLAGKATTEREAAFIQASVERSNDQFRAFVRARRPQAQEEDMQGQWLDGAEAAERGLADAVVSGLPEVITLVAEQLAAARTS